MRISLALLSLLAVVGLLANRAEAKPLYVNNSGSPACDDSTSHADNDADHPWCTLLRAVRGNADGSRATAAVPSEAAQPGDTVQVMAGTYDYDGDPWVAGGWLEPLYESVNSGTSWTEPIVYEAEGTVVLTVSSDVHASTLGGSAEYVKWIGFTVDESAATLRNGLTTITASHVHFEGLTLTGDGTSAQGDHHAGIELHGPRDGDCTDAIGDIVIRNCRISGFTGDSGRNDTGIMMYCAAGGTSGTILIEHNEIFANTEGIYAKSSYTPASNAPAVILRKNDFHDNLGAGIMTQAWSNWHIYQNLFLDNGGGLAVLAFEYYVGDPQPRGYVVANNTLVGNSHAFRLEGFCNDASGMVYRNNIAVDTTANSLWGESDLCSTGLTKANYDFDYNLYGQSGTFGNLHYIEFPLATWQSPTYDNQDVNSAEGIDPLFSDPTQDLFTLQAGSPCREGGANDGIDVLDLDGDGSTDDPITLGAYITGDETIGPTTDPFVETCAQLGGVACCASGETCPGAALGDSSDCSGVCCAVACEPAVEGCTDVDQDGYGAPASADCTYPELDCDDSSDAIHPAAQEICTDNIDNDCDGLVDAADTDACAGGQQAASSSEDADEGGCGCRTAAGTPGAAAWLLVTLLGAFGFRRRIASGISS